MKYFITLLVLVVFSYFVFLILKKEKTIENTITSTNQSVADGDTPIDPNNIFNIQPIPYVPQDILEQLEQLNSLFP